MCTIPAWLPLALTVGSTVIGAGSALYQADASAKASRYNAEVASMNAALAERRAKDALERGKVAEQRQRMETAQLMGRQRAAMAAGNVDVTFGSPLDTMLDTAALGELDALNIRRNAALEAYDHRVAAASGQADAGLARSNADSALTGGYLAAAGTVLGGAFDTYKTGRGLGLITVPTRS